MGLFSIFKSKKKNLFIHIPKTGGSTFVGLLKESANLTSHESAISTHTISSVANTIIKHIDFDSIDRPFKAPVIFKEGQKDYPAGNYSFFMLVRHPFDRVLSEFNFQFHILKGKEGNKSAVIISKLKKKPKNFHEYVSNPETQNYQCKFLLGRKLADPNPITEEEFNQIIKAIESLPIHCGVTNEYTQFIQSFCDISKMELNKTITVRKKTPEKFKNEITPEVREFVIKNNQYDFRLYNYISKQLDSSGQNNEYHFERVDQFIP